MIKQRIKNALLVNPICSYESCGLKFHREMSKWGYQLWTNFINGNYDEVDYGISLVMRNASKKEQRTFVISRYTGLLALEFGCSYGYAQKVIVGLFTKDKLASITNEFIEEMEELGK